MNDRHRQLAKDLQRLAQEAQHLATETDPGELAFGSRTLAEHALRLALRAARLDEAAQQ